MSFEFGIVAPEGILEKYRDLFESKDIFYTQLLPEENPTHVILEDSNNVHYDDAIWKAMISSLVGHILEQEDMTFTNQSFNRIEIFKP
ncbi:hypothetical protein [Cedecea neteri]|uniref:hypothetical protein n=1 Tax=Cedecea neteri TaxID=158822 RepID=UPI0004F8BE83|nr:hypothetical protein [Cedecea neteri]AIR66997.1 hypothetical protein LH86_18490 [Cedecea neteri]